MKTNVKDDIIEAAKQGEIKYSTIFAEKYEIGVRLQDENIDFPTHYHNFIEIVCQVNGTSTHFVDEEQLELIQGDILIIGPGHSHRNIKSADPVLNIIVSTKYFNNLVVDSAFDNDVIALKNSMLNPKAMKTHNVMKVSSELIYDIYFLLINQSDIPMYYIRQKLKLTEFIINLNTIESIRENRNTNNPNDVITYINQNIKTASLNQYAKLCNYSPSLISQKIKQDYNMNFVDILQEIKLREASSLLISTNSSIEQIIDEIGYTNKTHFYDLFKEKYSLTPSKYRKMYKQK